MLSANIGPAASTSSLGSAPVQFPPNLLGDPGDGGIILDFSGSSRLNITASSNDAQLLLGGRPGLPSPAGIGIAGRSGTARIGNLAGTESLTPGEEGHQEFNRRGVVGRPSPLHDRGLHVVSGKGVAPVFFCAFVKQFTRDSREPRFIFSCAPPDFSFLRGWRIP